MKKFIIAGFILAAAAAVLFCLGTFIMAQDQTPPESVTHDGASMGKVTFSHKGHVDQGVSCKECHHNGETPVQKCESCHTADAKLDAKAAYHKNCIDCHKAKEKGPTGCMECHKKG